MSGAVPAATIVTNLVVFGIRNMLGPDSDVGMLLAELLDYLFNGLALKRRALISKHQFGRFSFQSRGN